MKASHMYLTLLFVGYAVTLSAQTIPSDKIIPIDELGNYLKEEVKIQLKSSSNDAMASYFRDKFSERYFYDWKQKNARFETYNSIYTSAKSSHLERSEDHRSKFSANTPWKLPFKYTDGKPVNAYAMRHLARQHKMVDIAFEYFYDNKNPKYIDYFTEQQASLNTALLANKFETIEDGNGVYEVFRSGYRILNWLQIHNLFLGETAYSDEDQLTTIATLLQHGANLYENNPKFDPGNHQTRGMSALAMLSILFRDFKDADKWYERSMARLEEHLSKEINEDGFQFERTVHYHMSDIDNYYYVYQLAKISKLEVKPVWKDKLKSLFVTLTMLAYPDKSTPVLSDDTDDPWAEKNDVSGALTLGYLLFESPKMGYFANNEVEPKMFWYVTDEQLKMLNTIESQFPTMKSVEFPTTGYYIMREGWKDNDKMLIISAGLDEHKPDHQHGDMLGIQAMANGKVILPNYQVRYSLKDFEFFKNSMVKNVALVDDELQGKQYTSNQGGSGFGKFLELPNPKTIAWEKGDDFEVYVGSHDGFKNVGVAYSRQVVYLRDDFWIVKDNFSSDKNHEYKQVWQGHYSLEEGSNLIRSTFDDASGLDIYQLKQTDTVVSSGRRGKQWSVVSKKGAADYSFITVLFPYKGYSNRIDEEAKSLKLKGWQVNASKWKLEGHEPISLSKEEASLFFSVKKIEMGKTKIEFYEVSDVLVTLKELELTIQSLNEKDVQILFKGKSIVLQPGKVTRFKVE